MPDPHFQHYRPKSITCKLELLRGGPELLSRGNLLSKTSIRSVLSIFWTIKRCELLTSSLLSGASCTYYVSAALNSDSSFPDNRSSDDSHHRCLCQVDQRIFPTFLSAWCDTCYITMMALSRSRANERPPSAALLNRLNTTHKAAQCTHATRD